MDKSARRALREIQKCVEQNRIIVLAHFLERMDQRGLFWMDVIGVIELPDDVFAGGAEEYGRPKWIINGTTINGFKIDIVCILDEDELGKLVVFVTIYWRERL